MRLIPILLASCMAVALTACAMLGAAGSVAGAAGSVAVTTAKAAGDVVGAAARTVTGSGDEESK
jgi:hypothetical protein